MLIDCHECEHHECFDCPVSIEQNQAVFVFSHSAENKTCNTCFYFNDPNSDKADSPCALCFDLSNWEDWEGQNYAK